MGVAQFGVGQVLHFVHVLFVVVANTPRSGLSGHLALLSLWGYASHHYVITCREMRQSLASTAALQHPRQELFLGVYQRNHQLLQPVFVDRVELKAFVVVLDESSKGCTRLSLHLYVVGGRL